MSDRRRAHRTNLPVERGAFVGRVRVLDELARAVDGGARLVSLTGPEGIGKTRVALRAAARELPRFGAAGGVYMVDATDAVDEATLIREVGSAVGLFPSAAEDDEAARSRLGRALDQLGACLVVVDGLDRCPGAAARVLDALLDEAPDLVVWVTARQLSGAQSEREVPLSPLRLPKANADLKALSQNEAVQLFVERAAEKRRGYKPSAADLRAISRIVRQLDGVPLAIEIAAARARALSPEELLERLPRRIQLLGSGDDARPQRALRGAVAWSLNLLPAWERAALDQASVFAGGFDEAAALEVLDLQAFKDAPGVSAVLEALVEKSLLRAEDTELLPRSENVVVRHVFPDVVREMARERLRQSGQSDAIARRHATYYLNVGSAWAEGVDGHGGTLLRRRLEIDAENLAAVVEYALAAEPGTLVSVSWALRGALALEPVYATRGPLQRMLNLLDRALEPAEIVGVPPALRARAHEARARARRSRGQVAASLQDLEHALQLALRAKDRLLEARARANIGTHHLLAGDTAAAGAAYDEALSILRAIGERRIEGRCLGYYGLLEQRALHPDRALELFARAIAVHVEVGDRRWEGIHTGQRGLLLLEQGELEAARADLKRALSIHRELTNRRNEAQVLMALGDLAVLDDSLDDARAAWASAASAAHQVGDLGGEALALARSHALHQSARGGPADNELSADKGGAIEQARLLAGSVDDPSVKSAIELLARAPAIPASTPKNPPPVLQDALRVLVALSGDERTVRNARRPPA